MDDSGQVVVISLTWPEVGKLPSSFIWIKPDNLDWNDFGYTAHAVISRVEAGEVKAEYNAKAALLDSETQKFTGVGNAIRKEPDRRAIVSDTAHVFSLGASQEDYRGVIRRLGVDDGVAFLRATNDLVAINGVSRLRDFERLALSTDVYRYSLARTSEAYYALKNSKPILRGLDQEDVSSGPRSIKIAISDQQGGEVQIDFEFNQDIGIPKRTCVLIGKNGVGKSSALGSVAKKALDGIRLGASSDDDRVVASRVLAFTPGNEFTGTFPSERRKKPATYYKRLSTSRLRQSSGGNTASASIFELSRNDRDIARKSRFKIFLDAVFAINRPEEIAFRSRSGNTFIYLSELRQNYEQRRLDLLFDINQSVEPGRVTNGKYFHLSTGEVRFIKLLAQACTYIENGSLILLDEPETHLHPNFVARLMNALESLLADTGSCAIIATHSVYVVREVFHDQVFIVEKDESGRVDVKVPGMRTFGADISSISTFIFAEDSQSFLAEDTVQRLVRENSSFEEVREKYGSYLSREVMSAIRDAFSRNP
ncbi:AAA family ATPase [Sinorhizobium fredii]|uniref:AAA family ATPase n=1 Tax=Rhizobium fredii TaxID=380 RepID=UPI003CE46D65